MPWVRFETGEMWAF